MRKLKHLSFVFLLSLVVGSLSAQLPHDSCAVRYDEYLDQEYSQFAYSMLELEDGSIFMVSLAENAHPTITDSLSFAGIKVTILNPDRSVAFNKVYRDHGWHWGPGNQHALIQTQDGNLVMAGFRRDSTYSTGDGLLVKFTPKGDTLWTRLVGTYYETRLYGLTELEDGDLMVTGMQRPVAINYDVFIARCDPQGVTRWQKSVGYPDYDVATGILQNPSGEGFLMIGNTSSGNTFGGVSRYLLYVDSLGNKVWDKKLGSIEGGGTEFLESITLDSDGLPLISGAAIYNRDSTVAANPYLAKITWSGSIIWQSHLQIPNPSFGSLPGFIKDVILLPDESYLAVGALQVWSSRWHGLVMKFNNIGEILWHREYSPSYYFENYLTRVLPRRDEPGFFCYGAGHPGDTPQYDLWYLWLDPQGKLDTCSHVGTLPPAQEGAFTLYPNPANGEATLLLPLLTEPAIVQVTALNGAVLLRTTASPGQQSLPLQLEGFPSGMYAITLTLPNGTSFTAKLAISH